MAYLGGYIFSQQSATGASPTAAMTALNTAIATIITQNGAIPQIVNGSLSITYDGTNYAATVLVSATTGNGIANQVTAAATASNATSATAITAYNSALNGFTTQNNGCPVILANFAGYVNSLYVYASLVSYITKTS